MIIARFAVVWICLVTITCCRPASLVRIVGTRKGLHRSESVKIKRQTDELNRRLMGIEPSHYGDQFSREEHSNESMIHLRQKASIAEVFRHRLMACGLITTKSPERWRDRLIAELDEIITEIEHRCAVCKTLYDEPCRYEVLRSLIDPCPACCRRKSTKKRLLLTLQKVLEKSLNDEHVQSDSSSVGEEENHGHDSNIWPVTEKPMSRKTRSTTEVPMQLTTRFGGNPQNNHALRVTSPDHKFKVPWRVSQQYTTEPTKTLSEHGSTSNVNKTNVQENNYDREPSTVPVINGQPVDNVHDFLQQYMNLVYGGQPGNEQRKQFFLDQLCRNATNGRIVLQCKDIAGQRKTRSSENGPAEKVSTWIAGEGSNASGDVQKSLLFTTPSISDLRAKSVGCKSCWTLGRKRAHWEGFN
ncbi:uncharacterized protein LOC126558193 [Anopheles maculipalpis]|uniref:uncharacterized protein LOC126558193 n=1 Tax=Anopheles maculipalpis TaxID=1496333 RepID=UPI00215907D3|nr:uncharacterized protein LOC126558193 [Anopheles maculipalpis]